MDRVVNNESAAPRQIKLDKLVLFSTLGFPGSGKTYFAKKFAKELNVFHLNSDRVRLEIFPNAKYTPEEHLVIFRVMDFIAEELLNHGVSVIYDANSTKRVYRDRLRKIAKQAGAKYVLLWFQTPVEIALKRIQKRTGFKTERMKKYHRPTNESVLHHIRGEEEAPSNTEFHIVVDGKKLYKTQVNEVLKSLTSRWGGQ